MNIIKFESKMAISHNGFKVVFWMENSMVVGDPDDDSEDQTLNVVPNFAWTDTTAIQQEGVELYIRATEIATSRELDIPLSDIKSVTSKTVSVLH